MMSTPTAIGVLWIVFMLGMSAHMYIGLLPLFAGGDVREDAMKIETVNRDKWMMVMLAVSPLLMVGGLIATGTPSFRWVNFILSVLLSLANLRHLVEHLRKDQPDHPQNVLLLIMLILSLQLNYISYNWISEI